MRNVVKALRFPLGGIAKNLSYRDTTYPSEESVYSTPVAENVIGECAFSGRMRGGSRPGLKAFATAPTETSAVAWYWPNGDTVMWPGGDTMAYLVSEPAVTPDGSKVMDEHAAKMIYRDRYFKSEGAVWMASRTGDYADFDFGGESEEPTRAMAGTLAKAGTTGETITAFMAVGDQRLYVATARRLGAIDGEPTSGVNTVSENIGVISANAWCNAEGIIYFMGQRGLYAIGEGIGEVSGQIPEDLKGLTSALLVYDPEKRGVHILAERSSAISTGAISTGAISTDYFYDIGQKAFWPVKYPTAMRPTLGGKAVVDGVNKAIFKCADGVWRYWDEGQTTDDGTALESKVAIGPFRCGAGDATDGMLDMLTVTLGAGSAGVRVSGYFGKSAEEALAAMSGTANFVETFGGGWNENRHVRRRGAWCVLVVSGTGRWAYEAIQANIKTLGGLRNG